MSSDRLPFLKAIRWPMRGFGRRGQRAEQEHAPSGRHAAEDSKDELVLEAVEGVFPERDVIRGRVCIEIPAGSDQACSVSVSVTDEHGSSCTMGDVTIVDDVLKSTSLGSTYRETTFRTIVSARAQRISLCASYGDSAIPDVRATYDPFAMRELRLSSRFRERTGLGSGYSAWFERSQRPTADELRHQREVSFPIEPTFSFVVPLYRTPIEYLDEMVSSVLTQTYGRFELLLVDASPELESLERAARRWERGDERVRLILLEENRGIASNTAVGIEAAVGEFIAFLDHDDFLEPNLLYEYVRAINEHPDCDMLYCDEDKYLEGDFCQGTLKADFDWAAYRSTNYLNHLLAVRRSVLNELDELPSSEFDGAQDYCLGLLVAERARRVCHVPLVLYHWRIHEGSSAGKGDAKSWAYEAGQRALAAHYQRIGIPAQVSEMPGHLGHFRAQWDLEKETSASVVVVFRNDAKATARCVHAIRSKCSEAISEIIVIGKGCSSAEGMALDGEGIRFLELPEGVGYTSAYLHAARYAHGRLIAFLDERVQALSDDWLIELARPFSFEDVCCTTGQSILPSGIVFDAGIALVGGVPAHAGEDYLIGKPCFPDFINYQQGRSAAIPLCMMVRREEFVRTGGFDADLTPSYSAMSWCLDRRAEGRRTIYTPLAVATLGDASIRSLAERREEEESRSRFVERSAGMTPDDPFMSKWFEPGTGHGELIGAVIPEGS
ncbi:MAG: glycosyltransferase family 2 protein [Coriobacteriales bacterium]|jgi:GT2 family glycosyltransferase